MSTSKAISSAVPWKINGSQQSVHTNGFHLPLKQLVCQCKVRVHHVLDAMHIPHRVFNDQDIAVFEVCTIAIFKLAQQAISWRQVREALAEDGERCGQVARRSIWSTMNCMCII